MATTDEYVILDGSDFYHQKWMEWIEVTFLNKNFEMFLSKVIINITHQILSSVHPQFYDPALSVLNSNPMQNSHRLLYN